MHETTTATVDNPESDRLIRKDKACAYLGGIGLVTLYKLINQGDIQLIKIGRSSFISYRSVQAYIKRLKEEQRA